VPERRRQNLVVAQVISIELNIDLAEQVQDCRGMLLRDHLSEQRERQPAEPTLKMATTENAGQHVEEEKVPSGERKATSPRYHADPIAE